MEMLCMCDVIADITSFRPSVDSFAHRHEFAFKPAQLETRRMKYLPIHATSIIDRWSTVTATTTATAFHNTHTG
jgi:hypothetical protein